MQEESIDNNSANKGSPTMHSETNSGIKKAEAGAVK